MSLGSSEVMGTTLGLTEQLAIANPIKRHGVMKVLSKIFPIN